MGSNGSKAAVEADHYTLLGISEIRDGATPEQIRKAYHKSALKYHPDKLTALIFAEPTEAAREAKKEEIDTNFKKIVAAYEVLSDPVQRRNYDSARLYSSGESATDSYARTPTEDSHRRHHHQQQHRNADDDVDDEIPTDCAPGDFFKVFGPVFERNARWSVNKPVPGLGNEGSSMEKVDKFYEFWYSFNSNRDFTDTYHYKRNRERAKKETIRIRRLVDNAYGKDPRILRRKEEEKAEKERKKMEKQMKKEAEVKAAAKAAEDERRRREEEEKRAAEAALEKKKVKERERKLMKKERSRFRTLLLGLHGLEEDDVKRLCMWFDVERLRNVCETIEEGKVEGLMDRLGKIVSEIKREEDDQKNKSGTQQQTQKEKENESDRSGSVKEKPWGKEEIELLRKGMVKFPKGTPRRWEVVSEYIGTGRSVEEVLKAMKTVLLRKPDDNKAFDSFLEKRKPSKSIDSPLTTRIEVEGVLLSSTGTGTSSPSPPSNDPKSASGSTSSSTEQEDVWSIDQERALIQAMKTVPRELTGGARWDQVAAAVFEKTANQCKKKFALLKENLRSKKNSG